jgi:hypothetical protein
LEITSGSALGDICPFGISDITLFTLLLLIPEIHAIMSAVQQAVFVLMNARE